MESPGWGGIFGGSFIQKLGVVMKSLKPKILFAVLAMFALAACDPEVGSDAWCKQLKDKDKGQWTATEAKDFAKHCLLK